MGCAKLFHSLLSALILPSQNQLTQTGEQRREEIQFILTCQ
jgi:hypothetical protein